APTPARRARPRTAAGLAPPRPAPRRPRPWTEWPCSAGERSCALAYPLTQQTRRPENEHPDEHEKGEYILIVAAEQAYLAVVGRALLLQRIGEKRESADIGHVADVAGAERLDDAEQDASEHRTGQ